MSIDVREAPSPSPETPRRRSRLWLIAGAVVLLVAGVTVGVVATRGDSSGGGGAPVGARQLASIEQTCARWQEGYAGSSAPSSSWCSAMVSWMTDQVGGGQMMASTMWGDPEHMRATCQQWVSSSPQVNESTPGAPAWCGQMVDWMTRHMGDWDHWDQGWMMNGRMMGG